MVRRRRRVRGVGPIAWRRSLSAWRSQDASATARLRTTLAAAKNRVMGTSPMSRRHPLATSTVAGPFILAFERSAALRRAAERQVNSWRAHRAGDM